MAVTLDAITLQPIKAAPTPTSVATPVVAVAPQVAIVADSARGSRRDSQDSRGKGQSLSFRAVLDAAAAGKVSNEAAPAAAAKADPPPRPTKLPNSDTTAELNGNESSGLLEAAAYARRGGSERSDNGVRVYAAATSRYAQAFFADTRTYARPGESLELTV